MNKHKLILIFITFMLIAQMIPQIAFSASIFSDTFETGNFSLWTGELKEGGTSTVAATMPHHDVYGAVFTKSADVRYLYRYKTFSAQPTIYTRIYARFTGLPTGTPASENNEFNFLEHCIGNTYAGRDTIASALIQNLTGAPRNFTLYYVHMVGGSTTEVEVATDVTPAVNTWYCVELYTYVHASAGAVALYIDGTLKASASGLANDEWGSGITDILIGETYGDYNQEYTTYIDCLQSETAGPIGTEAVGSSMTASLYGSNSTAVGSACAFSIYWTSSAGDNCSFYKFGSNSSGSWANDTAVAFTPDLNAAWSNITATLNGSIGNVVQWRFYANNTQNTWGSGSVQSLTLTNQMSYGTYGKTSSLAGASCTFYVYWTTSEGTLADYWLGTNNSGSWANTTKASFGGGTAGWANVTVTLSGTAGNQIVWCMYANNSAGTLGYTSNQTFTVVNPPSGEKYTVYAASLSRVDIQAAINDVRANGDNPPEREGVVILPSGSATYTTIAGSKSLYAIGTVYYYIYSYGGIDIIGEGMDQTNLTLSPNDATYSAVSILLVDGINQKPFTIQGITFVGRTGGAASATGDAGISLDSCKDFRVTDCGFDHLGSCGISVTCAEEQLTSRGVVDHCNFTEMYKPDAEDAGTGYGYGVGVERNYQKGGNMQLLQWNDYGTPSQFFGSYNNVTYIEDCYFQGCRHSIVSFACGAYVARFNTFTDMHVYYGSGHCDAHGAYDSGATYGGRYIEVYNNTFLNPANDPNYPNMDAYARATRIRGGAAIVTNNSVTNYDYLNNFAYDQSTETTRPKEDYIWSNTLNGAGIYDIDEGTHIENVTFFLYAFPGYTPYTYPHPLTQTAPSLNTYAINSTTKNTACEFSAQWSSSLGLSGYIFGTNNTGSWVNETWTPLSGTVAWANVTKTLTNNVGYRVEYEWWANDTASQWSNSGLKYFTTTEINAPYYTTIGVNTTTRSYTANFYVHWYDTNLDYSIFSWNGSGAWVNDSATDLADAGNAWHNVTKVLPATVGDTVGYRWYCNNTAGTWSPGTGMFTFTVAQAWYGMIFSFRDLDSVNVNAYVTWSLYNSSTQLSYTMTEYTLLEGTYSLKTYFNGSLLNTTSLSTATYGNTTATITLGMKAHSSTSYGYITCNTTSITIYVISQTSTNLTFLATGSNGGYNFTISVPRNATWIKKDGATLTSNWSYATGYIIMYVSSLSTFELNFEDPTSISVALNTPSDSSTNSSATITFTYTPVSVNCAFYNASLWLNLSGTWQQAATNASAIQNATANTISYTFSTEATYVWNIRLFNSTHSTYATANYTLTIDFVYSLTITLNTPADLANQTTASCSFTFTPTIVSSTFVNASLWTNVSGTWALTASNTSALANATTNTITYSFTANATIVWNVIVYNSTSGAWATSNRTLTVSLTSSAMWFDLWAKFGTSIIFIAVIPIICFALAIAVMFYNSEAAKALLILGILIMISEVVILFVMGMLQSG